jgi:ATP-dependent DNA helicase RecG
MTKIELTEKLEELQRLPHETEWLEFKEAKNDFSFKEIGQYFSALCNEANLKQVPCAWLIFGIQDKNHKIVGTNYRNHRPSLDGLKHEIAHKTTNNITFIEIHELHYSEHRIILFQIPAAPRGIPIAWEGHWYGRDGESIGPLGLNELESIRKQFQCDDWSSGICEKATLDDLDQEAIIRAREYFAIKMPYRAKEIIQWSDIVFLNKARITIQNKITKTAILLLGREESEHFLTPGIGKISWLLKDENNQEKDYQHFGPPFLLNVEKVYSKIRNLNYRYLLDNTLFPTEVLTYEPYVIREALNNFIAHQDYTLRGRIQIVESPDNLLFTNLGSFLPGTVDAVMQQDAPQEFYRNHFLAQAMVNLNLIDTQGGGIKRMFSLQMHRYFPLPDYDLTEANKVKVRIAGKVIDENYTRLLKSKTDLDLQTVILLDRVQKKKGISLEDAQRLKKEKLIEGRYPSVFLAATIAAATGKRAEYIRNRPFDNEHYKKMVLEYLKKFGTATKSDIENLLMEKLSDALTSLQKKNKIRNMLHLMSKIDRTIRCKRRGSLSQWVLLDEK